MGCPVFVQNRWVFYGGGGGLGLARPRINKSSTIVLLNQCRGWSCSCNTMIHCNQNNDPYCTLYFFIIIWEEQQCLTLVLFSSSQCKTTHCMRTNNEYDNCIRRSTESENVLSASNNSAAPEILYCLHSVSVANELTSVTSWRCRLCQCIHRQRDTKHLWTLLSIMKYSISLNNRFRAALTIRHLAPSPLCNMCRWQMH